MHVLPNDTSAEDRLNQFIHSYVDLVYAAALRQMYNDANSAADVTQAVMIVLITKYRAGKLPGERMMAGWVLNVTRNTVLQFRRAAVRRARHEAEATKQFPSGPEDQPDADLRAALDRAMLALGPIDREVVARRYLQDQSLAEIGVAIGMNENTTGRRITRAIEKLRNILEPQGVKATPAALIAGLSAEAAVKAPAVCASITTPAKLAVELANRVLRRMTMVKIMGSIVVTLGVFFILSSVVISVVAFGGKQQASTGPAPALPIAPQPGPVTIETVAVVDGPSEAILKEVLAGLLENQGKLRSIHVVGSEMTAMYDPVKKAWTDIAHDRGQAWAEAAHQRRVRVEVTHGQSLIVNQNGFSPLHDESYLEAWDGTTLYRQYGPPDSDAAGETFITRYLKGDTLLGADFSMQLPWDLETAQDLHGMRKTIDRYPLDPAMLSLMKLSARRVMLKGGVEAMELVVEMPDDRAARKETFWFDPHRGYGLLARRDVLSINGVEARRMTRRIDQLVESVPGVFYPSMAEMYWEQQGIPVEWSKFEAAKVTANEEFPDTLFTIQFPAGIQIRDFDKNGTGKKREEN